MYMLLWWFMQCSVRAVKFLFKLGFSVSCSIANQLGVACHAASDVIIVVGIG